MIAFLRIIDDSAHSPAFNMAADLYCLEICKNESIVYLRLYAWEPPSITIGYMQKAPELLNFEQLNKDRKSWIRRPTGGRAVLHEEDITYSCIFPNSMPSMGKSVIETYAIISKCLTAGLEKARIRCNSHDSFDDLRDTMREVKLPCFLAPNRKEIMVNGRKLVGSAQKRIDLGVLQHGSIPFTDAYRRLPDYLQLSNEQRDIQKGLLASKSICLKEIDPGIKLVDVRRALIKGFVESLPVEAIEKPWTDEEIKKIEALANSEEFRNQWSET
jgi:lipoyl(octanoyl) transferase